MKSKLPPLPDYDLLSRDEAVALLKAVYEVAHALEQTVSVQRDLLDVYRDRLGIKVIKRTVQ